MAEPKNAPDAEKVTRKKAYAPTDGDYKISSVNLEEAENGVSVICRRELTDEGKKKIMKSTGQEHVSYELTSKSDRYVFEDKGEAAKFIASELDGMWSSGSSDKTVED